MRFSTALLATATTARFLEQGESNDANVVLTPDIATYTVETAPGETALVTEDDKWEMRRNGINFMDITETPQLGAFSIKKTPVFPKECTHQDTVNKLLPKLSQDSMRAHLTKFSSFHTRYFRSDTGRQSSEWLFGQIQDIIKEAGVEDVVSVAPFKHSWPQSSIIARIQGKSNDTVVIGAHQDSLNLWLPSVLAAPGADDDGSGTVTILEVFKVLLGSDVAKKGFENTVEFHWYSAEEGGLLGSQAIFQDYEKTGRVVKAMLQQDMTGYIKGTLDSGAPESVGVIMDFVDPGLTKFIKTVIETYCRIPWTETKCGYACSDHASASKAGYPSAFVIESGFEVSDPHVHSTEDTIEKLSFGHMEEHARMTLGLAFELGSADFEALEMVAGEL